MNKLLLIVFLIASITSLAQKGGCFILFIYNQDSLNITRNDSIAITDSINSYLRKAKIKKNDITILIFPTQPQYNNKKMLDLRMNKVLQIFLNAGINKQKIRHRTFNYTEAYRFKYQEEGIAIWIEFSYDYKKN